MKTQMRFQKILTLVTLILAALTIVYAFIFFSGSLADISRSREAVLLGGTELNDIHAENFYNKAQSLNNLIFTLGIVFVCIVATLYITATNKRRNYYITNYISIGLVVCFALVFAIIAFVLLTNCMNLFLNDIDWEAYRYRYDYNYVEGSGIPRQYPYYSKSTAMFAIGYVLFAIVIVAAVVWVLNLVWKIKLMQGEKALLENGLVKEVA